MPLDENHIVWRRAGIGGSDAITIARGNAEDWMKLKAEKIDDVRPVFTDDERFRMDLGTAVEPVILNRFEKLKGKIAERGITRAMKADPFFRCTLDGQMSAGTPVQCKIHFGSKDLDELVEFYWPQLQHEMLVVGEKQLWFAVAFGHWARFDHQLVEQDYAFQTDYMVRALQFKEFCWGGGALPEGMTAGVAPIKANIPRLRDHVWPEGDNQVAELATKWLETAEAAKTNASVSKDLKDMVPDDCRSATWTRDGKGIRIGVNKAGSKSIKPYG